MKEDSPDIAQDRDAASYVAQRVLCLDHARDLVASAERVLGTDNAHPNIAYHLAVLAMEEIGKAGMLASRAAVGSALDGTLLEKRFDDHVYKLMWAVWSPGISLGKIDPKEFEDARKFAESTHVRRMAGLYVDFIDGNTTASPREAVKIDHATSLLNLAKVRLDMEVGCEIPIQIEKNEELEWFLATASDDLGKRRLFSTKFIEKYQELQGNTRAWVGWAREEFTRIAAEEKEQLKTELARQVTNRRTGTPKWLIKIRLQTPSHSLRQKVLNYWNDRIEATKLRVAGNRGHELLIEMTLGDNVKIEELFDVGLSRSKCIIAMLNIGTAGFFWYDLSSQGETYYESISDLEKPRMLLRISKIRGLSKEWSDNHETKRQRVALEEVHLDHAIKCLAAFADLPEKDAEPIFEQYLRGLTLLSKTDLHLSVEAPARDAFLNALRGAMHYFGDFSTGEHELTTPLHRIMAPVIPDVSHRDTLFKSLDGGSTGESALSDAVSAKRIADLYLVIVARRLWPEFLKRTRIS